MVVDSGQASINYTGPKNLPRLGEVVDSGQASINYTRVNLEVQ